MIEEQKVAALVAGSKLAEKHLKAVLKACVNCEGSGDDCFDPEEEPGAAPRSQARARKSMIPDNLHRARHLLRAPGLQGHRFPHLRHRLGFRGLSLRLGPELQQFRARDRRIPAGGARRRAIGTSPIAAARQVVEDACRRASCGRRSPTRPGPAPIRASSSTPRSTTGTPARPAAKSAPPIRARNTCSWTTRPAISPR